MIALDDIEPGEEILGAYGVSYWKNWCSYTNDNFYTGTALDEVISSL